MIKNSITYNVEMPSSIDMDEFASDFLVKKPGEHTISTMGFAKHPITGDVVSVFDGGYCLSIVRWTKRIDRTAVNEELKDRLSSYRLPLKKKEKDFIKEEIILEMLPNILPSPKYIFAYYHENSKTLIIDSASSQDADQATSLMRKAIGSLKATTLYIDTRIGLTESLKNHLKNGDDFINGNIGLGNTLELHSQDGKVKFTDLDLTDESTSEEIVAQISTGGMSIKSVELKYNNDTFNLTNEFKIKRLKIDIAKDEEDDKVSAWHCETIISVESIVDITSQLVERFQVVDSE